MTIGFAEIVPGTQESISNEIEQALSYKRTDGLCLIMSVAYVDNGPCVGGISLWTDEGLHKSGEPDHLIEMNREELRYLRSLLNRPEVADMLEEDVDEDDTEILQ